MASLNSLARSHPLSRRRSKMPRRSPTLLRRGRQRLSGRVCRPLVPKERVRGEEEGEVLFVNVKEWIGKNVEVEEEKSTTASTFSVLVRGGKIVCVSNNSDNDSCAARFHNGGGGTNKKLIDLEGGVLAPGLTSFGSPLGLVEIRLEPSTNDGSVLDNLSEAGSSLTSLVGGGAVRAVDGLQFAGRNTLCVFWYRILTNDLFNSTIDWPTAQASPVPSPHLSGQARFWGSPPRSAHLHSTLLKKGQFLRRRRRCTSLSRRGCGRA